MINEMFLKPYSSTKIDSHTCKMIYDRVVYQVKDKSGTMIKNTLLSIDPCYDSNNCYTDYYNSFAVLVPPGSNYCDVAADHIVKAVQEILQYGDRQNFRDGTVLFKSSLHVILDSLETYKPTSPKKPWESYEVIKFHYNIGNYE